MSLVTLLAADTPLPAVNLQMERETRIRDITLRFPGGLRISPLTWARDAVEDLGYPMKPCRFELELDPVPEDCQALKKYLSDHLPPGTEVQLWSLWVGSGPGTLHRFRGSLAQMDSEALEILDLNRPGPAEEGQVCVTLRV